MDLWSIVVFVLAFLGAQWAVRLLHLNGSMAA